MRRVLILVLMFVLMVGLVAGAGYSLTVPTVVTPTPTSDSPGGGGGGSAVVNETVNETTVVGEGAGEDEVTDEGVVSGGIDRVTEFVKGFGWGTVLIVLAVLAVIGGTAWHVLKDKRKKFVEVRVKK